MLPSHPINRHVVFLLGQKDLTTPFLSNFMSKLTARLRSNGRTSSKDCKVSHSDGSLCQ